MNFKIEKINSSMSHKDKVYEYARRISHYSLMASGERALSKIFNCSMLDENKELCGERVGCSKRDSMLIRANIMAGKDHHEVEFCESCRESRNHYLLYREAVSKKATALRHLNKEMQNKSEQE